VNCAAGPADVALLKTPERVPEVVFAAPELAMAEPDAVATGLVVAPYVLKPCESVTPLFKAQVSGSRPFGQQ
jgi:hypothetical protein